MSEVYTLSSLPIDDAHKSLLREFVKQLEEDYGESIAEADLRFTKINIGLSRTDKLFLQSEKFYPFFIKVGDSVYIQREDNKFRHAARKIPVLSIPPKEAYIRDKDGKKALIAFRYITGNSKTESPQSLLSMYSVLPIYRMTSIVDDIFQNVLGDYHNFSKAKISEIKYVRLDKAEFTGNAGNGGVKELVERHNMIVGRLSRPLVPLGQVHGDLHGENVLVGRYYNPIVLDFEMSRQNACLYRDYAEFEIAMLFAAATHDFEDLENHGIRIYEQRDIFGSGNVDRFGTLAQRVRANLHTKISSSTDLSDKIDRQSINTVYKVFLLRYLCFYGRIANLKIKSSARRAVTAYFSEIFTKIEQNLA